jgi:hypothetical protein
VSPGERYVELCLRVVRHDDDLLDYFYGSTELAERVAQEPLRDAAELAADARAIAAESESEYLRAQLRGLEIVARKLSGEKVAYEEEIEGCYGSALERVPEETFKEAHRALDELLPPGGSLTERWIRWQDEDPVPDDRLERVLHTLAERLRARTRELVGLPEGETYDVEIVRGEHWYAYNDYRGGLRSTMSVNVDLPLGPLGAVRTVAHELYPGHHVERVWKEALLYADGAHPEESVLPYGTPQSVVTEGIATLAVELVLDEDGELLEDAFAECGVEYDAEAARRVFHAEKPLDGAVANAAIMLHVDGASPDDVAAYLQRWELTSEERAAQHLAFVSDTWGRAYIRTYTDGYELCRSWVGGDPARFRRLLTEQLTPADLS